MRRSWFGLASVLFGLLAAPCRAEEPDARLEVIRYKAPAGWQATDRQGEQTARVLLAPDSTAQQQAMILLVLTPPRENLDLKAAFDEAVKQVTSDGKVIEPGEVTQTKTRQGFDAVSRTLVTQGAGDSKVYARMIAARVGKRMAGVYYIATSQELFDAHQADMGALLQSVSFDDTAPPAAPGDAVAAKGEIEALERQKQELLAKVAEIEARQRVLAGAAGGTPPAGDADQQLTAARAKYAADLAGRRKAHTILGDVLGLDGRPIPNVAAYRVFVWGTTIAAERSRYGLDVDANGHFEQQVPDGLYQVKATCVVEHAGRRVPVDLVRLDATREGVDQASAAGIVRDYRLVVSGLKPGADARRGAESFYGGGVRVVGPQYDVVRGTLGTRFKGGKVRVTLTPTGPCVDGVRRGPVTIDLGAGDVDYGGKAWNIALADYTATAVVIDAAGTGHALTCSPAFEGPFAASAAVYWQSSKDDPETRVDPAIYVRD
jgi:hypothetical protein